MSRPPNSIVPSVRTDSTKSHMRLKVRSSVDLPQPEGPMKAVARFLGISRLTPLSAWKSPYQRLKSRMLMAVSTPSMPRWAIWVLSVSMMPPISRSGP